MHLLRPSAAVARLADAPAIAVGAYWLEKSYAVSFVYEMARMSFQNQPRASLPPLAKSERVIRCVSHPDRMISQVAMTADIYACSTLAFTHAITEYTSTYTSLAMSLYELYEKTKAYSAYNQNSVSIAKEDSQPDNGENPLDVSILGNTPVPTASNAYEILPGPANQDSSTVAPSRDVQTGGSLIGDEVEIVESGTGKPRSLLSRQHRSLTQGDVQYLSKLETFIGLMESLETLRKPHSSASFVACSESCISTHSAPVLTIPRQSIAVPFPCDAPLRWSCRSQTAVFKCFSVHYAQISSSSTPSAGYTRCTKRAEASDAFNEACLSNKGPVLFILDTWQGSILGNSPKNAAGIRIASAKTGLHQFALLRDLDIVSFLAAYLSRMLSLVAMPDNVLFPHTYVAYLNSMKASAKQLGVDEHRFTSHSIRYGGALHDFLAPEPNPNAGKHGSRSLSRQMASPSAVTASDLATRDQAPVRQGLLRNILGRPKAEQQ
eukprot:IDg3108t1